MGTIQLDTNFQTEFIDITSRVNSIVEQSGISNGSCIVFVPHTTAGVTINENADPDVKYDIIKGLERIIPFSDNYRHFEGNSAAHIKAGIMGFSQNLIIEKGSLVLGTWQGVYFCEFDGPRKRKIYVKCMGR